MFVEEIICKKLLVAGITVEVFTNVLRQDMPPHICLSPLAGGLIATHSTFPTLLSLYHHLLSINLQIL